jgi:hypothetical protein
MSTEVFTGATDTCAVATGIVESVAGAGLYDESLQQDPLCALTLVLVLTECCDIMGQSGGQSILESPVRADVTQAVRPAAGPDRTVSSIIRATNWETPLILSCVS